jgi:hypothetical protein
MVLVLALLLIPGVSGAQPSNEGFAHWKFDSCRAFVGRIEATDEGARVQAPKPQSQPNQEAGFQRSKTAGDNGRSVIFVAEGKRHSLDQAAPSRQEGAQTVWEQFEPSSGEWIVYREKGDQASVTIQSKQTRSARLGGVSTDIVRVLKYSSDGQYVEQAYAKNAAGDILYQNGTACGKAFGEETSLNLMPAGNKAKDLKFDIGTY